MTELLDVTYSEVDALAISAVARARGCLSNLEGELQQRLSADARPDALRVIGSIRRGRLFTPRAAAELDALLYAIADQVEDQPSPWHRDEGAMAALVSAEQNLLVLRNTLAAIAGLMRARAEGRRFRAAA